MSGTLGMMADYVCVPIIGVCAIPDSMSFEDAAALPLNYVTAYQILFDIGHLSEGESVLVQMAGGGVVSVQLTMVGGSKVPYIRSIGSSIEA